MACIRYSSPSELKASIKLGGETPSKGCPQWQVAEIAESVMRPIGSLTETGTKSRSAMEAVREGPASFGPLWGTRCGFDYVGMSIPSGQVW